MQSYKQTQFTMHIDSTYDIDLTTSQIDGSRQTYLNELLQPNLMQTNLVDNSIAIELYINLMHTIDAYQFDVKQFDAHIFKIDIKRSM